MFLELARIILTVRVVGSSLLSLLLRSIILQVVELTVA